MYMTQQRKQLKTIMEKSSVYISIQPLVKFMNQRLDLINSNSLEFKTKLNNFFDKYKEMF